MSKEIKLRPLPQILPYQVKYDNQFWVVEQFSPEAKRALGAKKYLLQHMILPTSKVVLQKDVVVHEVEHKLPYVEQAITKWMEADYEKARTVAEALVGKELQAGHIFSVPSGDGIVFYLVTRVLRTACSIEWRGWRNEDRYTDHHFGFGGKFPVSEITRYVRPGVPKLFGKK